MFSHRRPEAQVVIPTCLTKHKAKSELPGPQQNAGKVSGEQDFPSTDLHSGRSAADNRTATAERISANKDESCILQFF